MTLVELQQYYLNLLIIQYKGKPKAEATVNLLTEIAAMDFLPNIIQDCFDLETAVGVQLDVIGKYANVVRYGKTFNKTINLSDDDFRSLIKIAILKNRAQSSLYDIQLLIFTFFQGTLLVFDYQSMSMSYLFGSEIGTRDLAEMFVVNNLLPKPMGVQLGSVIYSNNITGFFGFRTYEINTTNNSPFNSYENYSTDTPWMSYTDAIIVS